MTCLLYTSRVTGSYVFSIPKAGYLFEFFRTPAGYVGLVLVPFAILIGLQVRTFVRLLRKDRDQRARVLEEELRQERKARAKLDMMRTLSRMAPIEVPVPPRGKHAAVATGPRATTPRAAASRTTRPRPVSYTHLATTASTTRIGSRGSPVLGSGARLAWSSPCTNQWRSTTQRADWFSLPADGGSFATTRHESRVTPVSLSGTSMATGAAFVSWSSAPSQTTAPVAASSMRSIKMCIRDSSRMVYEVASLTKSLKEEPIKASVKLKMHAVEKFGYEYAFVSLSDTDVGELQNDVAPLVRIDEDDQFALRCV